jgi:hypothetical protein
MTKQFGLWNHDWPLSSTTTDEAVVTHLKQFVDKKRQETKTRETNQREKEKLRPASAILMIFDAIVRLRTVCPS